MPEYLDVQQLRARTPAPQPVTGQELLRPKTDIRTIESFYGGVTLTNFLSEGYELYRMRRPETDEVDPNWNPATFLRDNPEHQWILDLTREDEDAFSSLVHTRNEGQMLALIENQKRVVEQYAAFQADPVAGWIGAITGAVVDVPLLLAPGVGALAGLARAVKTLGVARKLGAARLGVAAAAENLAFEVGRAQRDITVGQEEFLLAGAIGGAFGAGIGAGIPRLAGVTVNPRIAEAVDAMRAQRGARPFSRAEARAAATETPSPRSVGAAEPESATANLPYGGGSLGHSWLPFGDALRTIKQRQLNWIADNPDNLAVRAYWNEFSKLARTETVTLGERAGKSVRGRGWEENIQKYSGTEWLSGLHARWQIEYANLAEDLQDGFMRKQAREPIFRGRFDAITKYSRPGLTKRDFLNLTWWWMQHEGRGLDADQAIRTRLPSDLRPEEFERVRKAIEAAADHASDTMDRAWKQWHALGLVNEEVPPIPRYLPQLWNREAIQADEPGFIDLLVYNQGWDPPESWLVSKGFAQPGQRFSDLDDEAKLLARDEWTARNADEWRAKGEELLQKARNDLSAAQDEAVEAAMLRFDRQIDDLEDEIHRLEEQAMETATAGRRDQILNRLFKAETKREKLIEKAEQARERMTTRNGIMNELDAMKSRNLRRAERERIVNAQKKLEQAETKVEKTEEKVAKPPPEEAIDPVARARAMLRNINSTLDDPEKAQLYGFSMGDYDIKAVSEAPNLHPRLIDLTRSIAENDPRLSRFLNTEMEQGVNSYFFHMAPRAALQETFGTQDVAAHFKDLVADLPAHMRSDAIADINAMVDRGLGRHLARDHSARWISSTFRNINVPSFLSKGLISQAGDASIAHAALGTTSIGQTMGRTVKQFFGRDARFLEAARKMNKPQLMALIVGLEQTAAQGGRARRLTELDPEIARRGLGRPGSTWWHLTRNIYNGTEVFANGFMELNFMMQWNRAQKRGVRKAAVHQLTQMGWDSFPENYQATLRSRGVGPKDMERFRELFDKFNVEITPGVRMPDVDRWPAAAREKLERAVEIADGSAIVMPTLGDMPRWANHPLGAMFFQFTGFAYSSQNKFFRRLAQDPTAASHMQAIFMAIALTTMANGLRSVLSGREEEWVESWESPEGVAQNMYDLFIRGPFAVAWSANAAELVISQLGRPANLGLEAMGLPQLAPHVSRYQEAAGLTRALGPTFATADRGLRLIREGTAAATGGDEEFDQFWNSVKRYTPGAGLTQLYGLDRILGENN